MKNLIKAHPLISFFILSYVYLWIGGALFFLDVLPKFGVWPLTYKGHGIAQIRLWSTLLIWTPNWAAITVLLATKGNHAVIELFKKFLRWNVGYKWWSAAFGVPLGLAFLSLVLLFALGHPINEVMAVDLTFIFIILLTKSMMENGVGEEAGWRGYALPIMQNRFGPLTASVLLGLLWGFWHGPLFVALNYGWMEIINFVIMLVGLAIVYTWIYNGSQGSLLMVAVIHNVGNSIDETLTTRGSNFAALVSEESLGDAFNVLLLVCVLFLILLTKGSLGFKKLAAEGL